MNSEGQNEEDLQFTRYKVQFLLPRSQATPALKFPNSVQVFIYFLSDKIEYINQTVADVQLGYDDRQ